MASVGSKLTSVEIFTAEQNTSEQRTFKVLREFSLTILESRAKPMDFF